MNYPMKDEFKFYVAADGRVPSVGSYGAAGIDLYPVMSRIFSKRLGDPKSDWEIVYCTPDHCQVSQKITELYVCENTQYRVPLGIHVAIPKGWVGLLLPRSSTGTKTPLQLSNTVGVIDSDYRGEVTAIIEKRGSHFEGNRIVEGEKLVQLVLVPCWCPWEIPSPVEDIADLMPTERGEGGFGSTGA